MSKNKKALENALAETITGTLSYNGQRCTALKLLFVPRKHCDGFVKALRIKIGIDLSVTQNSSLSYILPPSNNYSPLSGEN